MVERAATPTIPAWRRRAMALAKSITFPLVPDDYLGLLNPAWSARELTGTIERIKPETARRVDRRHPAELPVARPPARPVPADRRRARRHPPLAGLLADLGPRPSRTGSSRSRSSTSPEGRMSPYFTRQRRARLDGLPGRRRGRVPAARSAARAHRCSSAPAAGSRRSGHVARARAPRRARRRDPHPLRPRARSGDLRRGPAADERAATTATRCIEHLTGQVPRLNGGEPRRDLPRLARARRRSSPVRAA